MVRVIDVDPDAVITATGLPNMCRNSGELGHACVDGLLIRTGHREHRHGVGWSAGQAAGQIAEYAIVEIAVEQRYIGIGDLPFGRAWQQRRIGTCLCGMQYIGFLLMRADEQRAGNNGIHGITE